MARPACVCALAAATVLTLLSSGVQGHGRLIEPPSRSSMWRYGFNTPPNYDDNQLFCGGVQVQYERNDGKCGVCGDPWSGPWENEPGGKYALGIIVRKYAVGDVMTVKVQLTASHKGYFEFRLCANDIPLKKITHDCLDQHVLKEAGSGTSRFSIQEAAYGEQNFNFQLKLPEGVTCRACVLQWKYNAGNSWGTDPVTGVGCIGCGNQEQFYGCADIAIGHADVEVGKKPELPPWYKDLEEHNRQAEESAGDDTGKTKWGVVGSRDKTYGAAMSFHTSSHFPPVLAALLSLLAWAAFRE